MAQLPWGVVAGAVAGLAGSVTVGAFFLVIECVPQLLWGLLPATPIGSAGLLVWIIVALACWACCGALAGLLLSLLAPCRRLVVAPVQSGVARLCRLCGLRALGRACGA